MHIDWIRDYCLSKAGVSESFPFDDQVLVFKVIGKMFALTGLKTWEAGEESINLKCDPERALELRASYGSVEPGYHMNKNHWNTLQLHQRELSKEMVESLIDHSYGLVVAKLPKKDRELLRNL
ncbi:MAG: MmcQ/YjbR family DNA-binding protein [Flavobacteriaceae bacterium]|nr:MmcQ/YjbR family DNA-binding protein [Flavobacteriaceae bacterium]